MNCAASTETILGARQHLKPLSSPESDVQIWVAHLDSISSKEIEHFVASLDTSERRRAKKFHSTQDRHRYVAAHGLLRFVLGETLGRPANSFFQAEDGIRDSSVTGVQTCALPI